MEKLKSKNSGRFSFEASSILVHDGSARIENFKRVSYQSPHDTHAKKFDDVFKLVDYLLFNQGVRDFEKIREYVSDWRRCEPETDLTSPARRSFPLVMAPTPLPEVPQGFNEKYKTEIENTMMEMANYAIKCMTDNYMHLDEHLNLDLTELLPGEPPVEPSTDNTSSKKKDRNLKNIDKDQGHNGAAKNTLQNAKENKAGTKAVKEKQNPGMDIDALAKRSYLKTAGQSPSKTTPQALNLGEESIPKPLDIDRYLVKRTPQREPPIMAPLKVDKVIYKKPSYKSRNASPPRSAVKTFVLDKNHPLNRNVDFSKTVIGSQPEITQNGKLSKESGPKLDGGVPQEPKLDKVKEKPSQSSQVGKAINGGSSKAPQPDSQVQPIKQGSFVALKAQSQTAVTAPKVKESCEQRVELAEWPVDAKKPEEKPEEPSLLGTKFQNISKYASLHSGIHGFGALRNMSGPPRKPGEPINK